MDVVYNNGKTLNIIVDNSTTAMTGGQENPGTGKTLLGEPSATVDIPALCRALGIKRVTTIDPYDLEEVERVLREELAADEASVVIAKAPCVLQFKIRKPVYQIDAEMCIGCKRCLQAGCGALNLYDDADGRPQGGDQPDPLRRLRGLLAAVQRGRHHPARAGRREGILMTPVLPPTCFSPASAAKESYWPATCSARSP